jgi:carbon monoxide dehydrogenase subunit G
VYQQDLQFDGDYAFSVLVPPHRAWDILLDLRTIVPCIPGATMDEFDGEVVKGRIEVKVGRLSRTYAGTARLTERDPDARTVVVEASGNETPTPRKGTASATIRASLEPESSGGATKVRMHTTMNITGIGPRGAFDRGVWSKMCDKLVTQFARNLTLQLAQPLARKTETDTGRLSPRPRESLTPTRNAPVRTPEPVGPGSDQVKTATASASVAPGRIFVNYRRDDAPSACAWLFDILEQHFGKDQVFKDIDSIRPGDNFVEKMTAAVERCDVLLALIGRQWLSISDQDGRRRLDNPKDWVRLEIEEAITRNVLIIPILVEGARMPRPDELPPRLADLAQRQALELSPTRFKRDIDELLRELDRILASA